MSDATRGTSVRTHADLIWRVADKLRGVYKQSEYGKVILPRGPPAAGLRARADEGGGAREALVAARLDRQRRSWPAGGRPQAVLQHLEARRPAAARRNLQVDDRDFNQTLLEFYAAKLYERLRRGYDRLGLAPA